MRGGGLLRRRREGVEWGRRPVLGSLEGTRADRTGARKEGNGDGGKRARRVRRGDAKDAEEGMQREWNIPARARRSAAETRRCFPPAAARVLLLLLRLRLLPLRSLWPALRWLGMAAGQTDR